MFILCVFFNWYADFHQIVATITTSTNSSSVSVDECGNIRICAQVAGIQGIGNPFTVEYIVRNESTAILGTDFQLDTIVPEGCLLSPSNNLTSLLINFSPETANQACGIVSIIDDRIFESEESIVLVLNRIFPFAIGITPATGSFARVTIKRDPRGIYTCSEANMQVKHYYRSEKYYYTPAVECNCYH